MIRLRREHDGKVGTLEGFKLLYDGKYLYDGTQKDLPEMYGYEILNNNIIEKIEEALHAYYHLLNQTPRVDNRTYFETEKQVEALEWVLNLIKGDE